MVQSLPSFSYILVTRNVWLFWREWAQMWKRCKEKHYFPLWNILYISKEETLKDIWRCRGKKRKPTRAQHLSTFPTSRVRTAVIPTWTFKCGMKCHITVLTHSTVKPQMFSFFRCFSLYMILVDTFLFIFADSESYMQ